MTVTEERRLTPVDGHAHRVRSFPRRHWFALTLTGLVAFVAVVFYQVMDYGALVRLDYHVHQLRLDLRYPQFYDAAYYLVMIGQRGPTALIAAGAAGVLAWHGRSWRPLVVLGAALLALNLVVGTGKLYTARLKPVDGTAEIFANGIIFPSGHASNVVLTWGIVVYLLCAYGAVRRRYPGVLLTILASLTVGVTSIYLDTHWLSDILAGWAIGAAILMATIGLDQRIRRPAAGRERDTVHAGASRSPNPGTRSGDAP